MEVLITLVVQKIVGLLLWTSIDLNGPRGFLPSNVCLSILKIRVFHGGSLLTFWYTKQQVRVPSGNNAKPAP